MINKFCWAGLSLGLVILLSACPPTIEHCKEGSLGCEAERCDQGDKCKFGLVCLSDPEGQGVCGQRKKSGSGYEYDCGKVECSERGAVADAGTDSGSAEPDSGQPTCECSGQNEVCAPGTSDKCLNFCEVPAEIPGSIPTPGACKKVATSFEPNPTPLTFDEVCTNRCLQKCTLQKAYCPGAKCDLANCKKQVVLDACKAEFNPTLSGSAAKALEDLTASCEQERDQTCSTITCTDGGQPSCDGITCSNKCQYNSDNACDDGDVTTAVSIGCTWGTDCGDCGPRKGPKPPTFKALGEQCVLDEQCLGHDKDLTKNKSWCLTVDGLSETIWRCMPDCSVSGSCPDGYSCVQITVDNKPITQGSISGHVCNPLLCI